MHTYGFSVSLHVWGDYACFTRPENKVERLTYDVMTPSAARGVLEAIYWKPEIAWVIDRIHVLREIRYTSVRRNEVKAKVSADLARTAMKAGSGQLGLFVDDGDNRQQRAATILRDVEYVIDAHFDMRGGDDPPQKHFEMFKRRAERGQFFHHPYLGCREFPASFTWSAEPPRSPLQGTRELGWMLHDIDFAHGLTPRFFHARLEDGVLTVPPWSATEEMP
jgi:CRISPR-associated protein Cas5d